MTPKRIQLSRAKGWRKPEGAIVVARPSKHGNPHRVVRLHGGWVVVVNVVEAGPFPTRREASTQAVALFERDYGPSGEFEIPPKELAELRGHDLACWCGPADPCHADPLLRWANP